MKHTAAHTLAMSRPAQPGEDFEALEDHLRGRGFDLRRSAWVTYLIETHADRDAAFAVTREASAAGWQASLYGDRSGWVVRVSRARVLRPKLVNADRLFVEGLAVTHSGVVRGFTVEDLRTEDCWDALAARLERDIAAVATRSKRQRDAKRRETARISRSA